MKDTGAKPTVYDDCPGEFKSAMELLDLNGRHRREQQKQGYKDEATQEANGIEATTSTHNKRWQHNEGGRPNRDRGGEMGREGDEREIEWGQRRHGVATVAKLAQRPRGRICVTGRTPQPRRRASPGSSHALCRVPPLRPVHRERKNNADPLFEVGVNEMSVRPTHDDMATGHTISGAGLLTPLRVDTMVQG